MTEIITLLLGILLIIFGRKLFWLFVATIGFVAGTSIAIFFLHDISDVTKIIIAIIAGLIGIFLATTIQRIALFIAGFIAGGYVLGGIIKIIDIQYNLNPWLVFIIGAMIGIIIMFIFFDWALIILSSFTGALLITQNIPLSPQYQIISLLILLFIGLIIQSPARNQNSRIHSNN